jgi:hypothetical protein
MKLFLCQNCGFQVYFENVVCERCDSRLGFEPNATTLLAVSHNRDGTWRPVGGSEIQYRFCANAQYDVCNWLVPADSPHERCVACRLNKTIPDLSIPENQIHWQKLEASKHRLIYSLLRLGLAFESNVGGNTERLSFDFRADTDPDAPVLTGHADGLITINITEADDAEREARRSAMGEPYRTLLGHFRHEVGHFYWNLLVRDAGIIERCRAQFGDESRDYGEALETHYQNGPPPDWRARYVSAYASAHPWEDFAETWAHYLHIVDTLETAAVFGLQERTNGGRRGGLGGFDAYADEPFERIIEAWLPLTFAVNSLNRSMGQPDLYPFVLSQPAIEKMAFVHRLVHGHENG